MTNWMEKVSGIEAEKADGSAGYVFALSRSDK